MSAIERAAIRRGWERFRADPTDGHLSDKLTTLSALFTILPGDPCRAVLPEFDAETREWWQQATSTAPFGQPLPWDLETSTVAQLVRVRRRGDQWSTYLALHRHGGVSLGTSLVAFERRVGTGEQQRGFRLCHLVGLAWIVADVQARVVERLTPEAPWEFRLYLSDTDGAELADLAEGWLEPSRGWPDDLPRCATSTVVVRHELETLPQDPDGIKQFALAIGSNIEDAFGSGHRRFVARSGDVEGDVDLRRWRL